MVIRSMASAIALLLASGAPAGAADSVSGSFTIDGKALKPAHVAAFRVRDQYAPREWQTFVMLTTRAVDREGIANSLDPYTAAINDDAVRDADWLGFHVDADGETGVNARIGDTQFVESSGTLMGEPGSLIAECRENTPSRVDCTVKTKAAVTPEGSGAWTLDVSFAADVAARPAGKPLPADGGEPGKALRALMEALKGDDLEAVLALLVPSEADDYREDWRSPEEHLESAKEMLGMQLPKQPTFTGGELLNDDYAVLEVEGVPWGTSRMLHLVHMRRTEGRWQYEASITAGILR